MEIIISGYGKMGHELQKIALERGHSIVAIYNSDQDWKNIPVQKCDVLIDFSTPKTAPKIINTCFDLNIPVVCGTTGWNEKLVDLKTRATLENKTFFYASNFSIGVNIFFEINKKLASFLCSLSEYHVNIIETHHIHKKDIPSGTAISLAEGIINKCNRYDSWSLNMNKDNIVNIISERIGDVTGTHKIEWVSEIDTIQLIHTAHSRKGFALGAIIAAEWLKDKSGVFNMSDLLNLRPDKYC